MSESIRPDPPETLTCEDIRTSMSPDALRKAIEDHLRYSLGRPAALLEPRHYYHALALAVRDRMQQRWTETTQTYLDLNKKGNWSGGGGTCGARVICDVVAV